MNATQIFLVYNGAFQVDAGTIQVGDIMAVVQYVMQIMMSLTMFTMIFIMMPRAIASARRITDVLETESSVHDVAVSQTCLLYTSGPGAPYSPAASFPPRRR